MMNGKHYKQGQLLEMAENKQNEYSLFARRARTTRKLIIVALFAIAIILVAVGISLIVLSSHKSCSDKERSERTQYCSFSAEAKRAGFDKFLSQVQRSYFDVHPHKIYHDPLLQDAEGIEAITSVYKAFNPTPEFLKNITDTSTSLLRRLHQMKINKDKLKTREKKALVQVKHYLQHMFGQPYDVNYYSGDWMLGPNQFCWQPVCGIGSDIFYHLDYFKPAGLSGLRKLSEKLEEHAAGIYQYIENMKEGVKRGMVRSVEECKAGIDAVKQQYLNISRFNATGVLQSWFMEFVLNPEFLSDITEEENEFYYKKTSLHLNESVQHAFVEYIGKPILQLIRYLEDEHFRHCVPSNISSGLSNLPHDYVYLDGVRTDTKTNKTLPTGEPLDGKKIYDATLSYFTTNNMTADQIFNLGKSQIELLYPQAVEVAKNATGTANETVAIRRFREMLTRRSNYFNSEPFPKNESDENAHKKCSHIGGAKKYCPKRWEAAEKWFAASRMAMSLLDPMTIDMFYFTGKKQTTPNCPIELHPDLNPSSAAQSYMESDKKCTTAAMYSLPFFLDNAGPRFSEWSVNAHEARPGHHTQVQGNIENFQDSCKGTISWLNEENYYTAYVEGWALYAENPLISDTDVYKHDLMQKYGMLKWQIWRALRLVVDTGIHSKRLTRKQALELFDKFAWDNTDIAEKEVTRYHSAFGHATAYMIGKLRLEELRDYTKKMLGDDFQLKEYHYQVLSQGPQPLDYLTSHIQKYVGCMKNKTEGCDNILSPPTMPNESEVKEIKMVAGRPAKQKLRKVYHRHHI